MDAEKRRKLERGGWVVGSTKDFVGMSPEEAAYVEMKLGLARELLKKRRSLRISQVEAARRIRSSQSRVAKMEAGDPSVSLDLLVRSLLALGGTPRLSAKAR